MSDLMIDVTQQDIDDGEHFRESSTHCPIARALRHTALPVSRDEFYISVGRANIWAFPRLEDPDREFAAEPTYSWKMADEAVDFVKDFDRCGLEGECVKPFTFQAWGGRI